MLRRGLLDKTIFGASVWADTAYRSKANEAFMEKHGFTSRVPGRRADRIGSRCPVPG